MNRIIATFFAGCFFFAGISGMPAETITVGTPVLHPDTRENRTLVESVLARAAVLADRQYADLFDVEYGRKSGDYHIEVMITFTETGPVGQFSISKRGGESQHTFPILGGFTEDKVSYYASAIASLWNAFTGGFEADMGAPPRYVDELPTEIIVPLLVPQNPALVAALAPISGAPLSDGSLVVGMSAAAARLDSWFRLTGRPGGDQVDAFNYNLAGRVFTTPADTIYLVPSTGSVYYRVTDGVPGSRRVRLGNDVTTTPLAVLHDGSVIQKNASTSDVERFAGRERTHFSLGTGAVSYVSLIATGPEGNLWAWDQVEQRVKIFSPEGVLLDSIMAIHPADNYLAPTALVPSPDGGFLFLVQGASGPELRKFGSDGRPEWLLNEISSDFPQALPFNVQPVVDPGGGNIYLIDYLGKRIIKFFDSEAGSRKPDDTMRKVLELNGKILADPNDTEGFAEKATFYEEIGASGLAQATWQKILEIDPYNAGATAKVAAMELQKLKMLVRVQDRRTREIFESLGPESARNEYSTAIRTYEQILARTPDDSDIATDKHALEELFIPQQGAPSAKKKPLTVASLKIEAIFPALINYYRSHPVGTVTIENSLDEPVFDVVSRLLIPKYMDLPSESEAITRLEPGAGATIDLQAVLKDTVLSLEEDLQFPAKVEIRYFTGVGADRSEQTVTIYPGVTVHRKTALTWDDSGKIAAFVVPREEVVKSFAINTIRNTDIAVPGLPERVVRAATLCNAVGIHGIEYLEDPDSPFSEIFGKAEVIDTVRFPRDTLRYRVGDCDDTTALLASLVEAVGVRSAIMTSPGHVFMAFDTGEPASSAWLFKTDELRVVVAKGNIWIPIETTTLSRGFFASWRNASHLVDTYADAVEFLPTADAQAIYPAIPLPPATFTVVEPLAERVLNSASESLDASADALYASAVGRYSARMESASAARKVKYKNQIGALHARFGHFDKAIATLKPLLAEAPDYAAAYVNLSNVYLLMGVPAKAVELLEAGARRISGSPTLSISLAQALYRTGRRDDAAEIYNEVVEKAPKLAERFNYLGGSAGNATARAGIEQDAPLLWDSGEE